MKKKSVFNNNEVDIDLLFNQPKHLKKMFGRNKNEDEVEEEDDDDEEDDNKSSRRSITPQMKKYIDDYIDSKKVKSKEKPKSALLDLSERYGKAFKYYNDKIEENAEQHKGKGIIENYLKKKFGK